MLKLAAIRTGEQSTSYLRLETLLAMEILAALGFDRVNASYVELGGREKASVVMTATTARKHV